ncbi:YibE/F family protein [Nocardioides litoris]|uniref:YibE/F family protein n=1 Tax=Nocardioides litoris TaxID=1926648 RepID=UPI001B86969D|nr:YibE/F family protein [Nocardioides litoris]
MGAHHPRHAATETRGMRRTALAVVVPLALLTLVALVVLRPTDGLDGPAAVDAAAQVEGEVAAIDAEACPEEAPDDVNGCGTATVRITDGADAGDEVEVPLPNGSGAPEVDVGDRIVMVEVENPDGTAYTIVDHQRGRALLVLVVAFALAVVAFARWRGLAALVGLAVSFGLLVLFVVPAILQGEPPLLVAIVGAAAITLTVLYLTHGLSLSTTVAVVGTLAALTLTGLLSALSVAALHLTGITDDLSFSVGTAYRVDTQGLLLAGIVIGSLGVLDDVTVTQGATVAELADADRSMGFRALYRAGSRVGRAHIASVINTIVLAYAGSALPLLVLIVAGQDSFTGVVVDQVIAQEVVRSVVATLGLVAAVPITTALAAAAAVRARRDPRATASSTPSG